MIVRALRALPLRETLLLAVAAIVLVLLAVARERPAGPEANFSLGSTYDAADGGYRAFYELLGREGVRVERFERQPAFLDDGIDTLAYVEPLPFDPHQRVPTAADVQALEAWVRGGGRLLYVGHDDAAAARGILKLPRTMLPRPRAHGGAPVVAASLRAAGVADLHAEEPLRWQPRTAATVLLADARGPLVLSYAYGRGRVIAVVAQMLFANAGIATGDRARLAVTLATPAKVRGVVAFDEVPHGYAVPQHWWSIVPASFVIALAVAGFALFVAFSGAAVRLGPPLAAPARPDRTTADFIDALAALFERSGERGATLADAAGSTSRTIARAVGLEGEVSNDDIAARIGRDDLRADFVALHALVAERSVDDRALVRGVALAQSLRKEFAAHDSSRN